MNKKSVSIFLALITATTALLTGCGGNLPGIASVTEVQGVNSSETVSSKEASESSKSSTSSVSSKDETTTNKDTPSTPEEKKEFDGSYQKNADGTIAMNYGAILHAWCWDFATITEHLDDIKEAGYTSIQTSPINQCKVGESGGKTLFSEKGGKWYYHYQPTDYVIGNYQLGSKEKFETLCKEAKKRDLKIIVDVPLNHVSSDLSAVTQNVLDICDNPFHDRGEIGSYSSRKQVTQNDLLGLKDLNTQDPKVQQYELKYLKDVIASGASGFRFDAAKHIELPDDEKEYASDFWTVILDNGAEFQYGEILQGDCDRIADYAKIMNVTASAYGETIRTAANGNMSVSVIESYSAKGVDEDRFVTWVESHDNYCNDGSWEKLEESDVEFGWAIIAARSGGAPLFFSRPDGSTIDDQWGKNVIGKVGSDGYKSKNVSALNHFRNEMAGLNEKLSNLDDDKKVLMIERGDKGAVIINRGSGEFKIDGAETVLADGVYKDKVTGAEFEAKSGKLSGTVPKDGIIVIY